ncbi:hypothetical protein Cfor_09963 [Coptotermes formosanus]|uniref:Uncharacterized protein n=1 Tax=Coptotermes formosanus TaxID=36987 RepID=A0A6L2PL54_COPFO|nr:hypothetical protein Cfor_09963 [Coptotermes formosanus]
MEHFERQSEHTADCHQISAPLAERRAEGESCQHTSGPSQQASRRPRIPFENNHM